MASDKKRASDLGAYIVFVDESGFMLMGTVCRTWAPRGQTPRIRYHYKHDRVSVISGLSVSPRQHRLGLYYQLHDHNIRTVDACAFLRDLLRHLAGDVIVLWDNGKIHKGQTMRDFCANHRRLHLENFPGYAPELNPDEGVWNQAKRALANGRPDDLPQLSKDVASEMSRIRLSPSKLRFCIHDSELPFF